MKKNLSVPFDKRQVGLKQLLLRYFFTRKKNIQVLRASE